MKTKDISEAKDPDLRTSMAALQRASVLARQTAIQNVTHGPSLSAFLRTRPH